MPVTTPWGEPSTVFDETLALSTAWVERLQSGLVVGSGDVILTFDAAPVDWERPGVTGVAMLQPDERGRVYSFLQKPSVAELSAAGGLLEGDQAALDTGLLRFGPEAAARLTGLAGIEEVDADLAVPIELYEHVTKALTGQWTPCPNDSPALHALSAALKGLPFSCSVFPAILPTSGPPLFSAS